MTIGTRSIAQAFVNALRQQSGRDGTDCPLCSGHLDPTTLICSDCGTDFEQAARVFNPWSGARTDPAAYRERALSATAEGAFRNLLWVLSGNGPSNDDAELGVALLVQGTTRWKIRSARRTSPAPGSYSAC